MVVRCLRHCAKLIVLSAALLIGIERIGAQAQGADDLAALEAEVSRLHGQGKYAEAIPIAERYVTLARERHGEGRMEFATAIGWLAFVYDAQGRTSEAEPLYERSLAIGEKALGSDHPEVAKLLNSLAALYDTQGRYAEAEPLFKRSLVIAENAPAPDHALVASLLNNLAVLYTNQGRYAEAAAFYQRCLALREKLLGPEHTDVGQTLNNLAMLYGIQGRYAEAEPLHQRSLAIHEHALGPDHPGVGKALNNLALLYVIQGRYAEADPLHQRGLAIIEHALGPDHPEVGGALNNLAEQYSAQGRSAEAERLYQRSLAILEKARGPDHPEVGNTLNNLAALYTSEGRTAAAEPLHLRSLAITEKALGRDHPLMAVALNNLAELYRDMGRSAEAEPLYLRSLDIRVKSFGPDHRSVGTALNNLAQLYHDQGNSSVAEPLYMRSLAITEKALGPDHPAVGMALNNLAELYREQGRTAEALALYYRSLAVYQEALGSDHHDVGTALHNLAVLKFAQRAWMLAADFWRRSTSVIVRRAQRGADNGGRRVTGKSQGGQERLSFQFWGLVKAAHRVASEGRGADKGLLGEMFQTAQWADGSEAAASLAQMAARGAKGDAALSTLVRERQDLLEEWQKRDGARTAAVSQDPNDRDRNGETVNVARLAAIDARIAEIDKRFVASFPDYAALARSTPLSVEAVQAQVGPDEALVLFLSTDDRFEPTAPEETFIWVVTKSDARWVRSDLGSAALTREVAALRCGLDAAAWDGDVASARCHELVNAAPKRDTSDNVISETLPFDLTRAHALYTALFGQIEDLIRGKHLLVVPSGPLTQLPLQVLVAAQSRDNDYKNAAWLTRMYAITVMPAVSSLQALRRVARPSAARKAMIGFGNPLLDGNPVERPWEAGWAALARQKQACTGLKAQQLADSAHKSRGVLRIAMRGGHSDLADVRSQMPLSDTADELCTVAKDLKLAAEDILLGANATETAIKAMSADGRLATYRVLHFATHGTLAGEISGTSEPGLIFTPPQEPTDTDDGYLSASEAAALKLDADWVILSACNTAAGGAQGAEALSGLARAFFYAGARAMLVSHWAVDSAATVKLITHAVGATTRDKKLGRAEALRRAMLAMIDKGEPREAHPAYWAPFVVVGEGAAAK